jgi:hypothetical protein
MAQIKKHLVYKLVSESQLAKEHFDEYPVWARFEEPSDIDEIVGWGIDREWLVRELETKHDGSNHAMYPVLRTDPLPDPLYLYIRASFLTPDDMPFEGYLLGAEAIVISIFFSGGLYTFTRNKWLHELNQKGLARIGEAIGDSNLVISPLRYWTEFRDSSGRLIEGVFEIA